MTANSALSSLDRLSSSSSPALHMAPTTSGYHALDQLLPHLASLAEADILRPHTDPHAAAVTALLVADWLAQPQLALQFSRVGLEAELPKELARIARAIVTVVAALGGDYLSDVKSIPTEIEARGQTVRLSTIKELERALPWDRDVTTWLSAVKMGVGVVDLVYDLRTLAELLTRNAESMKPSLARLPDILRAASDAIEYALRANETPEMTVARGRLARLWTLFVPAYERAAMAGRVLTREQGAERSFPPLALVAAHRRARRASAEDFAAFTLHEHPTRERDRPTVPDEASAQLATATATLPTRETGSRRAHRAVLELEVGIASESNFYVGFTENVSTAGVFVATYLVRPMGSPMEIALTFPGGETLRVHGVVCWQRAASEDGWPGMGVRFEGLSEQAEAKVARFIELREPMFYVE